MLVASYILLFLACSYILYFSCGKLVDGLSRMTRFFGIKEFIVAFFVMALASSLPNLILGVTSALRGIPELSFGDIGGNNVVALTVAVALAVFFTKDKKLSTENKVIQTTSIFTALAAVLPLVLILDGELSRPDGAILLLFFILYNIWLFSKREQFTLVYSAEENMLPLSKKLALAMTDLGKILLGIVFLIAASQGIVASATFFAGYFNVPIMLIGFLITGLGSALPEVYFAVISARMGQTRMILGNLMGAVIMPSTIVLGIVALIRPVVIPDFSPFAISRIFLIISALFFFLFVRTDKKISMKEAGILMLIYGLFVFSEIVKN